MGPAPLQPALRPSSMAEKAAVPLTEPMTTTSSEPQKPPITPLSTPLPTPAASFSSRPSSPASSASSVSSTTSATSAAPMSSISHLPPPPPIPSMPSIPVIPSAKQKPQPQPKPQPKPEQKWNTKHLGLRLTADAASGLSAAALVAPLIAIIDRSITENASGANTLAGSLKSSFKTLLLTPHRIVLSKPFALIVLIYGGTYLTANVVDTAHSTVRNRPASHVTAGFAKFAASSATNVGLSIYKDQAFVRMFGPPGVAPRPVPLPAYALFAVRDCMTIFASFNIPPRLGPYLMEKFPPETSPLFRTVSGLTAAQFATPALIQFASTPVHLLGLELYNRPWLGARDGTGPGGSLTWGDRFRAVRKNWIPSSLARIFRIVPAYGVGGVVNLKVRKALMGRLE